MDKFTKATQGISNFITDPDYIPTILLQYATEEQISACMNACQASGKVYNVYIQTTSSDEEWVFRIHRIADIIIDAEKVNPVEYFE